MSENSPPRLVSFDICDDIRPEQSGKLTLVGYYGRAIRVGSLPATLSKLCFLAQFEPLAEGLSVDIRVMSPSGAVLLNAEKLRVVIPDQSHLVPKEFRHTLLLLQIVPMPINEEGVYRADFAFSDSSTITTSFYVAADPSLVKNTESNSKPELKS
jgi:hypothetical protein